MSVDMFDQMFSVANQFLQQYGMELKLRKVKLNPLKEDPDFNPGDGKDVIAFVYYLTGPAELIQQIRNGYSKK